MIVSRSRTMHPQSPPLTIGGTVLKESLEMTFGSKMTIEKHLRSVSRAASQRIGILRKSCRVFHDRSFLMRCFRGFVLPFWSTLLQCGARLPIHILNYRTMQSVVPSFSLGVWLSVTLLIIDLWQYCVCCIRSGVTRCILLMVLSRIVCARAGYTSVSHRYTRRWAAGRVAHPYTYAPPRCRPLQYRMTFIPSTVSLWNDLADPYSIVYDWRVSRAGPIHFYYPKFSCSSLL